MCGGPSQQQKDAATSQSQLANQLAASGKARDAFQLPFLQSRVQNGLPFLNEYTDLSGGALAQQLAPQRNQLQSQLNRAGSALPSGFQEQALTDFNSNAARAQANNVLQGLLLNEQTKSAAAGMSNPLGYFTGAQQGYGNILSMPQQTSPFGSILGGALGGLIGAL